MDSSFESECDELSPAELESEDEGISDSLHLMTAEFLAKLDPFRYKVFIQHTM